MTEENLYYIAINEKDVLTFVNVPKYITWKNTAKLIDCEWIQILRFGPENYRILIDEEGKIKHKPINRTATILYNNPNDFVVGKILIVKLNDDQSDCIPMTMDEAEWIANYIMEQVAK